jgi:agmatinase
MASLSAIALFTSFQLFVNAREIVFPPSSGFLPEQHLFGYNEPDITKAKFAGLTTFANLPYEHCLAAEGEETEPFDIAIIGAPFDTVS